MAPEKVGYCSGIQLLYHRYHLLLEGIEKETDIVGENAILTLAKGGFEELTTRK